MREIRTPAPTRHGALGELVNATAQTLMARGKGLLVTAPGLSEAIRGAILFDVTLEQNTRDGVPFVDVLRAAGIVVGIKVDAGAKALAGHPGERVTEGLDGLPSHACIDVNAHALARYAVLCQEAQLVPMVEHEVLMEGAHTLARCGEVTAEVLHQVFAQRALLHRARCNGAAARGAWHPALETEGRSA